MRLLLDMHALLWFLADDPKLSAMAKAAIEDPANERWLSPISLLEIALKNRLGKMPLPAPFGTLFPAALVIDDIHLLPIDPRHVEPLTTLAFHHKDPFDRLIVATSLFDILVLVSADSTLYDNGVVRMWL